MFGAVFSSKNSMSSPKIFCCHSNALRNVSCCEGLPIWSCITLWTCIIREALAYLRDQETPVKLLDGVCEFVYWWKLMHSKIIHCKFIQYFIGYYLPKRQKVFGCYLRPNSRGSEINFPTNAICNQLDLSLPKTAITLLRFLACRCHSWWYRWVNSFSKVFALQTNVVLILIQEWVSICECPLWAETLSVRFPKFLCVAMTESDILISPRLGSLVWR